MGNDTALVRTQQQTPAPFEPVDLTQAFELAENLSHAQLLPTHLRGKPHDVFMTLLLGRDLGLTAMQAITGIHVIEGKPSVSAATAVALVKRSPLCKYFQLVESNDAVATYETQRVGNPSPTRMSFTFDHARRAGLTGKKNWQGFPAAMLRARCSMALAREVYQDVVANVYDQDEIEEQRDRAQTAPPVPTPPAAAPAPAAQSKPKPRPVAAEKPAPAKVIDIAPEPTLPPSLDDEGPVETPPKERRPCTVIADEFYAAVKKRADKRAALADLMAAAGKIPPLVESGAITAAERAELLQEFKVAKNQIESDPAEDGVQGGSAE